MLVGVGVGVVEGVGVRVGIGVGVRVGAGDAVGDGAKVGGAVGGKGVAEGRGVGCGGSPPQATTSIIAINTMRCNMRSFIMISSSNDVGCVLLREFNRMSV